MIRYQGLVRLCQIGGPFSIQLINRQISSFSSCYSGLKLAKSSPIKSHYRCLSITNVCQKLKQPDDAISREVDATLTMDKVSKQRIKLLSNSNQDLGIMTFSKAKKKAAAENLKIVLKDSSNELPVYQLKTGREIHLMRVEQQQGETKHKLPEKSLKVKGLISEHDLQLKIAQFAGWLKKGHAVKVNIRAKKSRSSSEEQADEAASAQLASVFKAFSDSVIDIATMKEVLRTDSELKIYAKPRSDLKDNEIKENT